MQDIPKITQDTDFTLRVRAKRIGYNNYVKVSFEEISNITTKLVSLPNTKTPVSYTMDEQGRLVIPVDGTTLDCNTYGVEIAGFYNNGNWRQMMAPAFEIIAFSGQDSQAQEESEEITIDLEVTLGETYVSSRVFAQAMSQMEESISRDAEEISETAGKADRIEQEMESMQGSIPTKTSELVNDSGYQTLTQVSNTVQEAVNNSKINQVGVDLVENGGEPSADAGISGQKINLILRNLKGDPFTFEDLTAEQKEELVGPEGPQGATVIYGAGDLVLDTVKGMSQKVGMTQNALTKELICQAVEKDLSALTRREIYISNDVWTAGGGNSYSYFLPVTPGATYRIVPNSQGSGNKTAGDKSRCIFLQDASHTAGQTPNYAGNVVTLPGWIEEEVLLKAPADAHYMYIRKENTSNSFVPDLIEEVTFTKDKVNIIDENIDDINAKLEENKNIRIKFEEMFLLNTGTAYNFTINGNGIWTTGSSNNNNCKVFRIAGGYKYLKVVSQENVSCNIQFLSSSAVSLRNGDAVPLATNRLANFIGTKIVEVPDTATHIYVRVKSSGVDWTPTLYYGIPIEEANLDERIKELETKDVSQVKPSYVYGGITKSGLNDSTGNKRSLAMAFDSSVEKVKVINPSSDKVYFILGEIYEENESTVYDYNSLTPNYCQNDISFIPESGKSYVIRMRPKTAATKEEIDQLDEKDYPFFEVIRSVGKEEKESDLANIVAHSKYMSYTITDENGNSENEDGGIISLLHFTDIHGDTDAAKKILAWKDKYKDFIDDVLNTGDVAQYIGEGDSTYPNGYLWWQGIGLPEISLNLIGNHDGATHSGGTWNWDGKGKAWDFAQYIEPYITGKGITMPTGYDDSSSPNYQACYWHKDYPEQKIRLIGLDCIHRFDGIVDPMTGQRVTGSNGIVCDSTAQEEWLVERLYETLDSNNDAYGYSVVIACHYLLDSYDGVNAKAWANRNGDYTDFNRSDEGGYVANHKTGDRTNWHLAERYPKFAIANAYTLHNRESASVIGEVNNFGEIIKAFMNNEGKFVAWIAGHVHCDMLYYPSDYPDILVCANTCAGIPTGGAREERSIEKAAANILTIDTVHGLLKIVRLGVNSNPYHTPLNTLCYDYKNRKIINEG